jgi:hypothetical protein
MTFHSGRSRQQKINKKFICCNGLIQNSNFGQVPPTAVCLSAPGHAVPYPRFFLGLHAHIQATRSVGAQHTRTVSCALLVAHQRAFLRSHRAPQFTPNFGGPAVAPVPHSGVAAHGGGGVGASAYGAYAAQQVRARFPRQLHCLAQVGLMESRVGKRPHATDQRPVQQQLSLLSRLVLALVSSTTLLDVARPHRPTAIQIAAPS